MKGNNMSNTAYDIAKANRFAFYNDYPIEAVVNGIAKKILPVDGTYANGAYFGF